MKLLALIFMLVAGVAHAQSPDNTRVPPAPSINILVTRTDVWTLGGPNLAAPGNFWVTRNGIGVLGASASKMALCQGSIHVLGRDKLWWRYTGTAWQATKLATIPCDPVNVIAVFNLEWTPAPVTITEIPCPPTINAPRCEAHDRPEDFKIYRNGIAVATVKYPANVYRDTIPDAPIGSQFNFQVSAVNAAGESVRTNQVIGTAAP